MASMSDYMIIGGLRAVMPYSIEASNLHVKTHYLEAERLIDSAGPFLALCGQKSQVEYICIFSWCDIISVYGKV